jgi:hypothetical protein
MHILYKNEDNMVVIINRNVLGYLRLTSLIDIRRKWPSSVPIG